MGFNRFRLLVLLRVIILFLTVAAFVYLIFFDEKYVTTVVTGFIIVFEVFELFNFIESTNKKLGRFFDAIKYNDFNMSFTHDNKLGKTFKELNLAFKDVVDAILLERQKREEFYQELQVVIENIASGIISIDEEGQVKLINRSALNLLNINHLKHSSHLNIEHPEIQTLVNAIEQQTGVYKTSEGKEIAIFETRYKLSNTSFRLFALQDIGAELQAREIEAWQNLTKVLRHEIMNSIAPISSLTSTLKDIIHEDVKDNKINPESLDDLKEGIETISGRSDGLINFINAYRDYTNLPEPNKNKVDLNELVSHAVNLMRADATDIAFEVNYSDNKFEVSVDDQMIQQVLINLIKNALEAVEKEESGSVSILVSNKLITVNDNGHGITNEAKEKIFMPFYSTKNRGSGIGLSLSKQIMQLHGGDLKVESEIGKGAIFIMSF